MPPDLVATLPKPDRRPSSGMVRRPRIAEMPVQARPKTADWYRVWGAIAALSVIVTAALLHAAPEFALQYWYLFNVPLTLAAFIFGMRGALLVALATVASLISVYATSVEAHARLARSLFGALDPTTTSPTKLADALATLQSTDPRALGAQSALGLIVMLLSSIFFGLLSDRVRVHERLASERVAENLKRYFSPQLVGAITSGARPDGLATVRKEITVLFADLRGFTALTERLQPEELTDILNQYLGEMTEVIFKYDGTLDKYIGDGIMAFFGDPISHGNDAERAMQAANAMRERFLRLRSTWQLEGREAVHIGMGLNTGYATVGSIGSSTRLEYTAIGSIVNVGARLSDQAAPGQILISQRTLSLVHHLVESRSVGQLRLQGVPYPVDTYEVVGLRVFARHHGGAERQEPWEVALARTVEDPVFRADVLVRPDNALRSYRLLPSEIDRVTQLAALLGYPTLAGLSSSDVLLFARGASSERLARGTVVALPEDRIGVILSGEIAVSRLDDNSKQRHLGTLSRGDWLLPHYQDPAGVSYYATADTEMLTTSREIADLISSQPVLTDAPDPPPVLFGRVPA